MTRFCSIFNQLLQLISARRVSAGRDRHAGGAARARASRAGTNSSRCCSRNSGARIRCARSAAAWRVARASWRISGSAAPAPVDPRVRQCASAVGALSSGVLPGPGAVSRGRGRETVPVQEQVAQSRCDRHRSVRGDVSLGRVSPRERRGEAAFHARSRRVLADLPGDHRRQAPRGADGAGADVFAGDDSGLRQGVYRLRLVRGPDGRRACSS